MGLFTCRRTFKTRKYMNTLNNILQSFSEHPFGSTISLIVAIYVFWWTRRMLKFRYLLQIKNFGNIHWQFAGIYDSPGAAYSALENQLQHISEYRIKCLRPVKQVGWWKRRKLRREIHKQEIAASHFSITLQ